MGGRTRRQGTGEATGGTGRDRAVAARPGLRRGAVALASALALLLAVAACGGADEATDLSTSYDGADTSEDLGFGGERQMAADDEVAVDAAAPAEEGGEAGAGATGSGAELPSTSTLAAADSPRAGQRIIKEGTVRLEVAPGEFDAAFSQVVSRAQALGGYVSGSSTSTDGDGLVFGQVTVRVPVDAYEDLLTAVGEAGEVVSREVTSQDVSEEFSDLEARRRNLQAQERFYLGLLEDAQTISDAISVQQQLEGVQTEIERITGRLNLLEDRTSLSTLTVRLGEVGADGGDAPGDRSILARAFDDAGEILLSAIGFIIVTTAGLLPFAVLLGLVGWVVWMVRRGRRPTPAKSQPTQSQPTHTKAQPTQPQPAESQTTGSKSQPTEPVT